MQDGPLMLPKARFEDELKTLLVKVKEKSRRDHGFTRKEYAFFVLAQEFWPAMVSRIFGDYEFLCSGVMAILRRKENNQKEA